MQSIYSKIAAYIILFTLIGITGTLLAKITEYCGMSQYMSHFIYTVIITIYAVENWILLLDLDQRSDVIHNERGYIQRIRNLTETNISLARENAKLKGEMTQLGTQNSVDNIQSIILWKSLWA